MTRAEWQEFHGISDEDMERIDTIVRIFDGRITEIITKVEQKKT